jgi:hypothetical protein
MNNNTTIKLVLTAALGVAIASVPSAYAQSTLGGAKQQQNKIGGVAKPAPVVGGAVVHTPSPPAPKQPAPAANLASKPASIGTPTPTTTANAQGQAPRPAPPVTTSKKSGAVVTSNMKCSGGACTSVVPKP